MLRLSVLSLVLALVSALLTFTGLLGEGAWVGEIAFIAFLVSFIVTTATMALKGQSPD